jgi:NAD(P)-dependent dehydrogenase (short-subunit alcohol dehydrogenase family)
VVVNYASSKQDADRVVDDIGRAGGKAVAVKADLSKPADIKRLFTEAKKAFGQLDILVNNAGIYEFSPLEEITEARISTNRWISMSSGRSSRVRKPSSSSVRAAGRSST